MKFITLFFTIFLAKILFGQASFTIPNDACIDETINIENTSTGLTSYSWDFCIGEIESSNIEITSQTLSGVSAGYGYKLVEENGIFYSFVISRGNNSLFRITHGSSPNSIENVENLGNLGVLSNPEGLDIKKIDDNWYGVIGSLNNNANIIRIDFPDGIDGTVNASSLGTFGFPDRKRHVDFFEIDNNLYLVFSAYNNNRLVVIEYGNSIDNEILAGDIYSYTIPNMNLITGFDIQELNGDILIHTVSRDNTNVVRLNFGSSLMNTPSLEGTYSLGSLSNSIRIELIREGSKYFGIVGSESTGSLMFDFGSLETATTPVSITYDEALPGQIDFDLYYHEGNIIFHGLKNSSQNSISFENVCNSSLGWSDEVDPNNVSFNASGERIVWLQAYDSEGNSFSDVDTITILPQIAPAISYTSDYVCVSSPITFDSSNPGLTSYSWDFGDGSPTSSDENPSHLYASAGDYTVRVDVNDGTCDNFYEQQITIYPEPPAPMFTAISSECTNTDITFTNTTDESQHTGMLYKWDFDNDGIVDSTDPSPTYAYATPGLKTVVLTDSIPGCSATSIPFNITINPGPTADFFAPTACQGEAMQFTNTSSGVDNTYFWDFTDGFTSTNPNPSHIFSDAGNYFVELTATDGSGCSDTQIIEVAVSDSPQISFDFDIPCTSADGTQFFDLSTVDNADIVSWIWYVDDEEVSTDQSPQIVFGTTGLKNIRLDVQSSNGCESSYSEDIEVLSAPVPDFDVNIGCQGEESVFTDNTTTSGNPIVSWLWTVDGVNYGTQDISHVFATGGFFDVTLEVTGQNFCSESITKTIEIIQLPTVDFSVSGECDNQLITAIDNSTPSDDPVVSRRWMLDGANVGNGTQLFLENLPDATYELELELETTSGCIISTSEILEISEAPQAAFSATRTYGIPGDLLTFTNTSTGEVGNEWLLDGTPISTSPDTRTILFEESGSYTVSLVAQNSLGCYDTASQEILIAIPEVDLAIGSFELVQENNTGRIFLEVQNFSNLPVEITEAQIVLENEFTVTEQILEFVDVNETKLVSLNVGIPLVLSEPAYFCVKLSSQYTNYPDINPVNDEKCLTILPDVRVEDPFPNPVTDRFRLKVIAPEEGTASLTLINSAGKIMKSNTYASTEGLNNFFVEMSALDPGIYHIVVELLGTTHKRKVIKL